MPYNPNKQIKHTTNTHTTSKNISTENFKSPIETNIVKRISYRLPISPPIPKIENPGKTLITNLKPNNEKPKHILTIPAKLNHTQPTTEQKWLKISNLSSQSNELSISRIKSPKTLNHINKQKQCNTQVSTKTLNRSYSVDGFMPFPSALTQREMQRASSRISSQVANFISYDDTLCMSIRLYISINVSTLKKRWVFSSGFGWFKSLFHVYLNSLIQDTEYVQWVSW